LHDETGNQSSEKDFIFYLEPITDMHGLTDGKEVYMKDINLEEAKIKVDEKWLTAEEIASEIQKKIQAGDMKIADYASSLERLTVAIENSHMIEVKLVIIKQEYNMLRELGKGDDKECIHKAIQAFIGRKNPTVKKSLEEKISNSGGLFLEKTDTEKTVVKCIKCKSSIEIPNGKASDGVCCPRCNEEDSMPTQEVLIKYKDHFLG
jgi:hypothetical protein